MDTMITCRACHHDRDRHGPEAGGCIECRCSDTFVRRVPLSYWSAADELGLNDEDADDLAESMEQMRRGEGTVLRPRPTS